MKLFPSDEEMKEIQQAARRAIKARGEHKLFAWWPTRLNDGQVIWLERYRRVPYIHENATGRISAIHYRLYKDDS